MDEELIARGYQDMIESDDIKYVFRSGNVVIGEGIIRFCRLLRRSGQPGWFYTSVEVMSFSPRCSC